MVYVAMSESIRVDRVITDRRSMGWRTVMFGFLRSRRRDTRRHDEGEVLFLDWHHPWLFFLAVGTMLMSVMDAFMTLQLLDRGMVEANPVRAAALGQGTRFFAVSKMLMTGTSILALVFLAKARFLNRFRAGLMLTVFFSVYACLICYEFVFLLRSM
jgi:hypothetical protein